MELLGRIKRWETTLVILLLACFVVQSFIAATQLSLTYDEKRHLPNGYLFLKTGTAMNIATPVLAEAWAALPLPFIHTTFPDPALGQIAFTDAFFRQNDLANVLLLGRSMMILLGILLGFLVFHWAKALYGSVAGLFALFLYSFNPTILGYGPFVLMDLPLALAIFAFAYAAWKLCEQPSWKWLCVTGVLLGIAQLVKYPAVLLAPLLILLLGILYFRSKVQFRFLAQRRWAQFVLSALIIFAIAWVVVNAVYGFRGTFTPFSVSMAADPYLDHERYPIERGIALVFPNAPPAQLRIVEFSASRLPLLVPYHYAINFLYQVKVSHDDLTNFLNGAVYTGGRWDYYVLVFLMKQPIAFLFLLCISVVLLSHTKRIGNAKWFLLVPALFFFVYFSLSARQIALRYVLMVFPFLFVGMSSIITALTKRQKVLWIVALLCGINLVSAIYAAPDYLSYANEAVGENAYRHMVEGNLDMGQGLILLKKYMATKGLQSVSLSYFGDVDPLLYGVQYENYCPYGRLKALPSRIAPANGIYAVSVTNLQLKERECLAWLQRYGPQDNLGSLLIYNITDSPPAAIAE